MKLMKNIDNKICKVCQVLLLVMLKRSEASASISFVPQDHRNKSKIKICVNFVNF
ncbi:hypothetical protein GGR21_000795 [Dysgonomonas hofstadii]|uniref:Uncharacterized protein n=1 Tax=Dysgonomonas hofstadii TaxID=637886 RepID=A0A840CLI2_9BACT|nr:hypothetical protein [Dysgonomonas hofstadii]